MSQDEMSAVRPAPPASDQALKPRIIQADHRRYSLKLEPLFWSALEELAQRRGQRLNHMVADIAREAGPEANLASQLRMFCLTEYQAQQAEREVTRNRLDLGGLMDSSPIPALLIAPNMLIRRENQAFTQRFGATTRGYVGRPLQRFFRLQTAVPLLDAWTRFAQGEVFAVRGRVVHAVPGRVTTAEMRLFPVPGRGAGRFYCIMWIALGLPGAARTG